MAGDSSRRAFLPGRPPDARETALVVVGGGSGPGPVARYDVRLLAGRSQDGFAAGDTSGVGFTDCLGRRAHRCAHPGHSAERIMQQSRARPTGARRGRDVRGGAGS